MHTSLALAGMGVVAIAAPTARRNVDRALLAAIVARDRATMARDADEVARYTADDWFAISPTGTLFDKARRIAALRQPLAADAPSPVALRMESVRIYGRSAAVVRLKAPNARQLVVWLLKPHGWQAAMHHIVPDEVPERRTPGARPNTPQTSGLQGPAGLSADGAAVFAVFKDVQDAVLAADRAAYDKACSRDHVCLTGGMVRFGNENSTMAGEGFRTQPAFENIAVQVWGSIAVVRWLRTGLSGVSMWTTRVFATNASGGQWQGIASASSSFGAPPVSG